MLRIGRQHPLDTQKGIAIFPAVFIQNGQVLLAKHVVVERQPNDQLLSPSSKQAREQALRQLASKLGVSERMEQIRSFLTNKLHSVYEYPGKEGMTLSLLGRSESGKPSPQAFASLYVYESSPGKMSILFHGRVVELLGNKVTDLRQKFNGIEMKWGGLVLPVDSDEEWEIVKPELDQMIPILLTAWQARLQA